MPARRDDWFHRVVDWQRRHGRHHLPWQGTRNPYHVWLSEVMLQQTQVVTVLDYYPRFLARFPTVQALAAASEDEVLALWSGLGYYSRARHLHRCAQVVVEAHAGHFPEQASQLAQLPGIGASTAAAIAAFCFGERICILDGNVKRVLARALAFEPDLSSGAAQRSLWDLAQALLPARPSHDEMVAWTQGLMDLGAGVCARTRPRCGECPLEAVCTAAEQGRQSEFPRVTRRVARRHERWYLLALWREDGAVALQRRPSRGIWAGLYSLPVFATEADLTDCALSLGIAAGSWQWLPARRHALTHRELDLHLAMAPTTPGVRDEAWSWHLPADWPALGMPAPVRTWLEALAGGGAQGEAADQ